MIVFDTETTGLPKPEAAGLDAQPRIIEFGAVKLDAAGEEVDRLDILIHPGCALPPEIVQITGITDAMLEGAPTFDIVLPKIEAFFFGQWSMIAHNCAFDHALLRWELERLGRHFAFPWPPRQLCTVQLYEQEFGKRMKLVQLYEAKLGRKLPQKHRAMSDVEALLEIVRHDRLYELD